MSVRFTVRVPATSANLGPGFDCMGIALNLFNEMSIETGQPFSIEIEGESAELLPRNEENVVVQTMFKVFNHVGATRVPRDFKLHLVNHIPIASGLGSSATAIVGGILLANAMLEHFEPGRVMSNEEQLLFATDMEGHPDNVTAAFRGGACLSCVDQHGLQTFTLPIPNNLFFVVAIPYFMLPTEEARHILPKQVSREDAIYNISQASRLVLALSSGQLELLKVGFGDRLHEPYRRPLIPGFSDIHKAATKAGALTTTLSGAGPSILAWCDSETRASVVADEITRTWRELNVPCRTEVYQVCLSQTGVAVLEHPTPFDSALLSQTFRDETGV